LEQPPLYLFSGLGADERMFRHLRLHHPHPQHIRWIPALANEPLPAYARRLLDQLEPTAEPPILLGLSFGGMVAQEVAKLIPVKKVILLSSLRCGPDLPWYYRLAGALRLHQWLPFGVLRKWQRPLDWAFGAKTEEDRRLLKTIVLETELPFLRWALHQILYWQQPQPNPNYVSIHGDRDKILPLRLHPNTLVVKGGEHLMLLNRAPEVSALLNQWL